MSPYIFRKDERRNGTMKTIEKIQKLKELAGINLPEPFDTRAYKISLDEWIEKDKEVPFNFETIFNTGYYLMTRMSDKGASEDEFYDIYRYLMVVTDTEFHVLDVWKARKDFKITELYKKYGKGNEKVYAVIESSDHLKSIYNNTIERFRGVYKTLDLAIESVKDMADPTIKEYDPDKIRIITDKQDLEESGFYGCVYALVFWTHDDFVWSFSIEECDI